MLERQSLTSNLSGSWGKWLHCGGPCNTHRCLQTPLRVLWVWGAEVLPLAEKPRAQETVAVLLLLVVCGRKVKPRAFILSYFCSQFYFLF